jgi:hypothetical protein
MTKGLEVTVYVPRETPAKGNHGSIVRMALAEEKIKGDARDYALIDGSVLVTSFGRYTITSNLNDEPVDVRNVEGDGAIDPNLERTVVHRRNLYKFIGPEGARKFWRFGRRTRR